MAATQNPTTHLSITPHLCIQGAAEAIDFYKKAFGAEEIGRHETPDGKIMHAALKIGDSMLFLADDFGQCQFRSPKALGGNSVVLNLYGPDVDALWQRATDAGASVVFPLANQFWGDRYGQVQDPFGHIWALGTHIEDVTPAEMEERAKAAFAHMPK